MELCSDVLVLASGSPRRRELLGEMGVKFEVQTAEVTELSELGADGPGGLAIQNAILKAEAVSALVPNRWVLGADTIVALNSKIYGKPKDHGKAFEFLRELSGKRHDVLTGVALARRGKGTITFCEVTTVTFKPLSDDEIHQYIETVHVLDKAGAYAAQGSSGWIIQRVEGSLSNVIGLPVERLRELLVSCGILV